MGLFNRLPGYVPAEPGRERVILRAIPTALTVGLSIIWLPSILIRLLNWPLDARQLQALIGKVDIYALAVMWCYGELMLVIGIGAFIIMVMKGPAYVADPYPLPDADRPANPLP